MPTPEPHRLTAWATEMQRVHDRIREALEVTRNSLESGDVASEPTRDLLLHCWGFCAALSGHHQGEDALLFPALVAQHPELAGVVDRLVQDHSMIEHLLGSWQLAVERRAAPEELLRHLEGVAAIMESHFGYEERSLLAPLEGLELAASPGAAFGPLA